MAQENHKEAQKAQKMIQTTLCLLYLFVANTLED